MPLSHIGIAVSLIPRSRTFYEAALKPLDMVVTMELGPDKTESGGTVIGFGEPWDAGLFWIGDRERVGTGLHIAFEAKSREAVDAFYDAAMAAGGRDNGKPGLRPNYGPNYYAAFVLDPDGANVEAVFDPRG